MSFDPDTFLNTTFGEVSDKRIPMPADDYLATVKKVSASSGTISKGDRAGQSWQRLDVTFQPVGGKAEEAAKAVGLEGVPTIRYGIMLNFDENGRLATGPNDNPDLGKLLNALGLNGSEWSPNTLVGQSCTVRVKHKANPETGESYADVAGVAPAA